MVKKKARLKATILVCVASIIMMMLGSALTFAYFTSKVDSGTSTMQFGVLELDPMADFSITSDDCHTPLIPGCTIKMNGKIKLSTATTVDAYVRMKPNVTLTKGSNAVPAIQAEKFVTLFNNALTAGTSSKWQTASVQDGYVYYAGMFSRTNTGTNIVSEVDLSTIQFVVGFDDFDDEWQGVTVTVGLTVEAVQAGHLGVDVSSGDVSSIISGISGLGAWESSFPTQLNDIYSTTGSYASGYVRGSLNTTEMNASQVALRTSKSAYSYFSPSLNNNSGNYIAFGYYPQTIKADSVSILGSSPFAGFASYKGSDGYLYVKQTATPCAEGYTYSDGTAITADEECYFKLEPIVWRLLTTTSGNALAQCVSVLKGQVYYEENNTRTIGGATIYQNNYKYSYARAYLNGYDSYGPSGAVNGSSNQYYYKDSGFLQTAFTTSQANKIKTTTVDNSMATTENGSSPYACENTSDKIFMLSFQDMTNSSYGFDTNAKKETETRIMFPTDFGGASGLQLFTDYTVNGAGYYLRSPDQTMESRIKYCFNDGWIGRADPTGNSVGLAIALNINL